MNDAVKHRYVALLVLGLATILSCSSASASPCGLRQSSEPLVPVISTHRTPPWPQISERLNEQGQTTLNVTVGADGSVIEDDVDKSSGSERLDEAAAAFVKQTWRWEPSTGTCRGDTRKTQVAVVWALIQAPSDPSPASVYATPLQTKEGSPTVPADADLSFAQQRCGRFAVFIAGDALAGSAQSAAISYTSSIMNICMASVMTSKWPRFDQTLQTGRSLFRSTKMQAPGVLDPESFTDAYDKLRAQLPSR